MIRNAVMVSFQSSFCHQDANFYSLFLFVFYFNVSYDFDELLGMYPMFYFYFSLFLQINMVIICEGSWAWLCLHDFIDILQKVLFTHMECE